MPTVPIAFAAGPERTRLSPPIRDEHEVLAHLAPAVRAALDWCRVIEQARPWVKAVRDRPAPFWALESLLRESPTPRPRSCSPPTSSAMPTSTTAAPSSAPCWSAKHTRPGAMPWPRCARRSNAAAITPTMPKPPGNRRRRLGRPASAMSCGCTAPARRWVPRWWLMAARPVSASPGRQQRAARTGCRRGGTECVSQRRPAMFCAASAVCARGACRCGHRDDPWRLARTERRRSGRGD